MIFISRQNNINIYIRRKDHRAQFSAIDVVLFTVIVLISSSILLHAVNLGNRNDDTVSGMILNEKARETLSVMLRTSIDTDTISAEKNVNKASSMCLRPIDEVLAEHVFLTSMNDQYSHFNDIQLKRLLISVLVNLTAPDFGFVLNAEFENTVFEIGSDRSNVTAAAGPDLSFAESPFTIIASSRQETVHIKLGLWRL